MTAETLVPPVVYTIWWIGLVVTLVVFVPMTVLLLHRLWRTARSIQLYARDALTAAAGIAANTAQIGALNETIHVASDMLTAAGAIERQLSAATTMLARRSER
jgi:hypothetical protein